MIEVMAADVSMSVPVLLVLAVEVEEVDVVPAAVLLLTTLLLALLLVPGLILAPVLGLRSAQK
jgi:hypothetical protein